MKSCVLIADMQISHSLVLNYEDMYYIARWWVQAPRRYNIRPPADADLTKGCFSGSKSLGDISFYQND